MKLLTPLFIILIVILPQLAFTQNLDLFSFLSKEDVISISNQINSDRFNDLIRIENSERTKSIELAKYNNIPKRVGQRLPFSLSNGLKVNLKIKFHNSDVIDFISYKYSVDSWTGDVIIKGKIRGSFAIINDQKNGTSNIGGYLTIDNNYYEIIPFEDFYVIFRQLNEKSVENEMCSLGNEVNSDNYSMLSSSSCSTSGCSNPSFHLVHIVTPEYVDWLVQEYPSNPWTWAIFDALTYQSFRMAMQNSGYPNASMTWTSISLSFPYYDINDPDILEDLDILDPIANNLMNTYNADAVVMVTGLEYPIFEGRANCIGPGGNCRFAIVEAESALGPRWTYPHELAHCFGARHDQDCSGSYSCEHGWKYSQNNGEDRTVMHCLPSSQNNSRGLRFSNPSISVNGYPTGTLNDNNATWLANTLCDINGFNLKENIDQLNSKKANEFELFPNPAKNEIIIDNSEKYKSYEIINSQGKIIKHFDKSFEQFSFKIKIGELESGVYFIRLVGEESYGIAKFLKQ